MQTKSGTNSFHGSVYDYRHSDAQQARDPFTQYPGNNPVGPDIPSTLSNVFGGTIGGPDQGQTLLLCRLSREPAKVGNSFNLRFPRPLVHTTCTGGDWQLRSERVSTGRPGPGLRSGHGRVNADGANTGVGRMPFANNQIPNSRLSPAAINLLKIIPLASTGMLTTIVASGFGVFNFNQADTRIDYQLKPTCTSLAATGTWVRIRTRPLPWARWEERFWRRRLGGSETGGNDSLAVGPIWLSLPSWLPTFAFPTFVMHSWKPNTMAPLR